ncbi:MAG: GNAT family N-acetyltransferase [Candidatus Bathycorpusculaceae bacterium]
MFKINSLTKKEIPKLKELKKLCDIESGWNPPEEYLEEWIRAVLGIYNQDINLVKVALDGKKVIGYCISVKKLHNYDGVVMDITWKSAYIWDLFVLKEYRKMGIGTALLNDAVVYLKSTGVDKVGLLVNYWNEDAKRLFEKLGFKLWSHFLIKRL